MMVLHTGGRIPPEVSALAENLAAITGIAERHIHIAGPHTALPAMLADAATDDAELLLLYDAGNSSAASGAGTLIHDPPAPLLILSSSTPVASFRRIVLPVTHADVDEGHLERALTWARVLAGHETGTPDALAEGPGTQILHLAADPDELHRDAPVLRHLLRMLGSSSSDMRVVHCLRWGAPAQKRLIRWTDANPTDLIIMSASAVRHGPGERRSWLGTLLVGECPVLLVPPPAPEPRERCADRPPARMPSSPIPEPDAEAAGIA